MSVLVLHLWTATIQMTGQTLAFSPYVYCDWHQFGFVFFQHFCFVFARSHGIGE